jgi:hypothetical protein
MRRLFKNTLRLKVERLILLQAVLCKCKLSKEKYFFLIVVNHDSPMQQYQEFNFSVSFVRPIKSMLKCCQILWRHSSLCGSIIIVHIGNETCIVITPHYWMTSAPKLWLWVASYTDLSIWFYNGRDLTMIRFILFLVMPACMKPQLQRPRIQSGCCAMMRKKKDLTNYQTIERIEFQEAFCLSDNVSCNAGYIVLYI